MRNAQTGVGAMGQRLFCALFFLLGSFPAGAACIDSSALVQSTVGISREFSEEERKADPDELGVRGTGWFLASQVVVTVAHVAEAMHLSMQDWKDVEVRERGTTATIPVRILSMVGSRSERIAVLGLKASFPAAATLPLRTDALIPEESVVSLGYPKGQLRFAGGRFVQYGTSDRFPGTALLEMHDGKDRLVLDHGASGAPVVDCRGRVVAVVSTVITQTLDFISPSVRVSTAWQTPNVISVPIQVWKDTPWLE
jgi:S1-C subfamily serine protease